MSVEPIPQKQSMTETPRQALEPVVREKVIIAGRCFLIERPAESDRLMDHPAVQSAFEAHEYLPYWTELWPAARMLAKVIMQESWPVGIEVLEVGCGLGLPGIAALTKGARVTFSDCDLSALCFAEINARLNGFQDFRLMPLDWHSPPAGLRVPLILASDLIYELRNINPLVALIQKILLPGGTCLLTDQDRLPAYNLRDALDGDGLKYTTKVVHAGERGGRRARGTLYRIQLPR
jgi:predicted nicotinamide N-methyase